MEQASFTVNASTLVDKHIATVLVVDDTPENLTLMGALLRDHFMVKVANNGEKALKIAISDTLPDLVLLDIMMPGTDGYEVCRRLKATAATRDIPVIFLTARSDPDDERMGRPWGRWTTSPSPSALRSCSHGSTPTWHSRRLPIFCAIKVPIWSARWRCAPWKCKPFRT